MIMNSFPQGVPLPELSSPAASGDIRASKDSIDQNGNLLVGTAKVIDDDDVVIVPSLSNYPNTIALADVSSSSSVSISQAEYSGISEKTGTFGYKRYVVQRSGTYRVTMAVTYPGEEKSRWYGSTIGKIRVNNTFVISNDNYNSKERQFTNNLSLRKGDVVDFGVCAFMKRISGSSSSTYSHSVSAVYTIDYCAYAQIAEVPGTFKEG